MQCNAIQYKAWPGSGWVSVPDYLRRAIQAVQGKPGAKNHGGRAIPTGVLRNLQCWGGGNLFKAAATQRSGNAIDPSALHPASNTRRWLYRIHLRPPMS
ncbi:hypothetical protein CISG_09279 [Coccidioides immitis RMSCC 3703]|uniref:Uncharacterized protein n=1 Tax=Coccidioides immitis RMSCC 3703 TaxID=454286 RepID=A0A0J8U551_COCIT|nr:hypothetical protein CISG_09279 [Coccidioides immitis RMSCC 3703]